VQFFTLTLHGDGGILYRTECGETEFVIGQQTAPDVFSVADSSVAQRHAMLWIGPQKLQVEELEGETLVNGYLIKERVEVEYPASVQTGNVTLLIEPMEGEGHLQENAAGVSGVRLAMDTLSTGRLASGREQFETPAKHAAHQGAYNLAGEIARGGMGCIYTGFDDQLGRRVAIKISTVSQDGIDLRLSREAEVLAHLAHPNIVPVYNKGCDDAGRPFYAMKLVKGRSLQDIINLIRAGNPAAVAEYPTPALLTMFRKVCDAMAFAHSQQILHRDLKPDNVMVGEYGEVLVMDWGLAKRIGEDPEEAVSGVSSQPTQQDDFGMTMEGEVVGTPQYMSPEQAEGMIAELDQRSDVYALGAVLYAIFTLRPPVDGTSLHEVLTNVRSGKISAITKSKGEGKRTQKHAEVPLNREVPQAIQAVILKAMARRREKRYPTVAALAADIEAFQHGFATSAEAAGFWKRGKLWIQRNKALAASAALMFVMATSFTAKVVSEGRRATAALSRLSETAPTFAARAQEALQSGQFQDALIAISTAVDLQPKNPAYHEIRGDALQVLSRWNEAAQEYRLAPDLHAAQENLALTESLLQIAQTDGEDKAREKLFEALNTQGRQAEALTFGKTLGNYWKDRGKDLVAAEQLSRILEEKLIPVPNTDVLMSSTETTVAEWKLYLKAEGLLEWTQPSQLYDQTDEHPVVNLDWKQAKAFCAFLSQRTGKDWRLPLVDEWNAAVGESLYPWGDYYPPQWNDGNYSTDLAGRRDPQKIGVDWITGTAPVASFKPNALGFYDLGGNVWEWAWDAQPFQNGPGWGQPRVRGGGWTDFSGAHSDEEPDRQQYKSSFAHYHGITTKAEFIGFRVVQAQNDATFKALLKRLEAKLLPVPGTGVLMSATECTIAEWMHYLALSGTVIDWAHPSARMMESKEQPAVNISWNQAEGFCKWLSARSGKVWRLPTKREWLAAAGEKTYPWGGYFPPLSDDGNYSLTADGKFDDSGFGVDLIYGTAPVASFRPNGLGFYDMAGNVWEWSWDLEEGRHRVRGGGWRDHGAAKSTAPVDSNNYKTQFSHYHRPDVFEEFMGIRLVQEIKR